LLFALLLALALYLVTRLNLPHREARVYRRAAHRILSALQALLPIPQLYLGISFGGWSVPMAFRGPERGAAARRVVLYIAAVIWRPMYDTIYAMVDRREDD